VGLAVTEWIDARADHAYSGAFLFHQEKVPVRNRIPRFIFPGNNPASGRYAFCAWAKKHRPDAVISFHTYVPEWLKEHLGWRIPEDIGLVVHDWTEAMQGFAGIHHRRPFVAAAAVDLLVAQLMRHERGVPEVPHQLLVPPSWIPGGSVRATARGHVSARR
jgi:LacI family transcriptional regulator